MNARAIAALLVVMLSGAAHAGDADPVSMAHDVGFVECDKLIRSEFENAYKSANRRVSLNYFPETSAREITLTTSFGTVGDTVYNTIHFSKSGGACYSTSRSVIYLPGNCTKILLTEDQNFKLEDTAGDAIWTKNAGGILMVMQQVGPLCAKIFHKGTKMLVSDR